MSRLFHLKMVYFAVVQSVEEINNETSGKHEKCAGDMKKPKNAGVLTKTEKRRERPSLSNVSSNGR